MSGQRVVDQPSIPGLSYVRPLGSGGFAQVHLYEQDLPRRSVAVKVIDTAPNRWDTFEREADAMAALSAHPSIVSVYQAGMTLAGRPYLVMEYCPASLGALTKGRPAKLAEVLDAGVRLAGALETAHRAQMLHRDIKPSNVLMTTLGRPALSDFGIARPLTDPVVPTEDVAMSVPWSAPEVVRLESPGTVASEVWSLAATLYTFAAGRSPFAEPQQERNTRAKLIARISRAVIHPIPGAQGYGPFDAVLARAMRRDPLERYQSMAELGAALQELQRGYGFDVTPLEIVAQHWIPAVGVPDTGTGVRGAERGASDPAPDSAGGASDLAPGAEARASDPGPGELVAAPGVLGASPEGQRGRTRRGATVSAVPGRRSRAAARAEHAELAKQPGQPGQPSDGGGSAGRPNTGGYTGRNTARNTGRNASGNTGRNTARRVSADGVLEDRPVSAVRAGVWGAGIALGAVGLIAGVLWAVSGGLG